MVDTAFVTSRDQPLALGVNAGIFGLAFFVFFLAHRRTPRRPAVDRERAAAVAGLGIAVVLGVIGSRCSALRRPHRRIMGAESCARTLAYLRARAWAPRRCL